MGIKTARHLSAYCVVTIPMICEGQGGEGTPSQKSKAHVFCLSLPLIKSKSFNCNTLCNYNVILPGREK